MQAGIKLHGLKELQQQLADLKDVALAAKVLAAAARKSFLPVLEAAKGKVPVDSGALRESLVISVSRPKKGDSLVVVGLKFRAIKLVGGIKLGEGTGKIDAPSRRWHFIELGTVKMSAHPFLRPAMDSNSDAVLNLLRAELSTAIDKAVKRMAKQKALAA